ncbi:MAG: nitrilase-related carbon-nitrogen hydrolase [Coprococcus sp.]
MLKVGITELDIAWENKEETKRRCIDIMEKAQSEGVELLVFPEMTLVGFTMTPSDYAESYRDGKIPESISFFMKNSRKYNMAIAFGYIEASMADGSPIYDDSKDKIYENKLALVKGDNLVLEYAKIHPFSYSGEDKIYHAGDSLCQAKVKDIHIGGYICYDLRFPEIFTAVREKYDTIMVIANWPEERVEQWNALLKARAIENQAYVIGVNRVGQSNGLNYVPSSHVYDCYGNELAKRVSDELLIADINGADIIAAREKFPQGKDRKNKLYSQMLYSDIANKL